jgi:UDP-3-O-acyl-N-acetylglucosamine deacetylase
MAKQASLRYDVEFPGINIFNGDRNRAVLHPLGEGEGTVFGYKGKEIRPSLEHARPGKYGIGLENSEVAVELCEHLLSDFYALGIANVFVELSDGVCPTPYNRPGEIFDELMRARAFQSDDIRYLTLNGPGAVTITHPKEGKPDRLTAKPADSLIIDCYIHYPHKAIGPQHFRGEVNEHTYRDGIVSARSLMFLDEDFRELLSEAERRGLKGFVERNFLLIDPEDAGMRDRDEELVMHKFLDAAGELAVIGPVKGEFHYHRAGHEFGLYALRELFRRRCFPESY